MAVQKDVGNCCLCIPLRFGVGLLCLFHFMHSFVCIFSIFVGDVRLQGGGYNPHTNRIQVYVGSSGLIFAIIGLLGVYDNKAPMIRVYNWFQYVKLATTVLVFVFDMKELLVCESWMNNMQSQLDFNPSMDPVSKKGLCTWVRLSYIIGFLIDFTLNFYFTYVSYIYCWHIETTPPYFISFGDDVQGDHRKMTFHDAYLGEPGQFLEPITTKAERGPAPTNYGTSGGKSKA